MKTYKTIAVFCGCSERIPETFLRPAYEFGRAMARRGIRLVYGAGKTGMMGAVANGVLEAGGEVTGVVNESLDLPHLIHSGLTSLEKVGDLQTRKRRMMELAEAVVALPGGYGTLDEFFEALALVQVGEAAFPAGLLNTRGYYDPLLAQIAGALRDGFVYPEHTQLVVSHPEPEGLLDALEAFQMPGGLERWVTREESDASTGA